ncbi:hypothetical protein BV22DRAFT_1050078 [Leucogyrophana mollusca]|uniref:Uncharacterized protein n=1 Tax=Leucogyrophana mollusca TaxID=85980 RepID=A0ACB8B7F7_9AGAM|nr:hypothetical protein BV22DRAFT_1050078 [Leucogyrophana mollusca]
MEAWIMSKVSSGADRSRTRPISHFRRGNDLHAKVHRRYGICSGLFGRALSLAGWGWIVWVLGYCLRSVGLYQTIPSRISAILVAPTGDVDLEPFTLSCSQIRKPLDLLIMHEITARASPMRRGSTDHYALPQKTATYARPSKEEQSFLDRNRRRGETAILVYRQPRRPSAAKLTEDWKPSYGMKAMISTGRVHLFAMEKGVCACGLGSEATLYVQAHVFPRWAVKGVMEPGRLEYLDTEFQAHLSTWSHPDVRFTFVPICCLDASTPRWELHARGENRAELAMCEAFDREEKWRCSAHHQGDVKVTAPIDTEPLSSLSPTISSVTLHPPTPPQARRPGWFASFGRARPATAKVLVEGKTSSATPMCPSSAPSPLAPAPAGSNLIHARLTTNRAGWLSYSAAWAATRRITDGGAGGGSGGRERTGSNSGGGDGGYGARF